MDFVIRYCVYKVHGSELSGIAGVFGY